MESVEPLVFTSWVAALFVLFVVCFGSVVQAGMGMGFGLTAAPVLALVDPVMVPAPVLYLGAATAIAGAWSERENIVWPEVGIGMSGRGTGMVVGAIFMLYMVSQQSLSLLFGLIILSAVIISAAGWNVILNTPNLLGMGLVSGFTGVITSVGAPPMALIYQNRAPEHARPTLAAFFAFGGILSLAILYSTGLAGDEAWKLALFMAPAAFLGTVVGRKLKGRFDKRYKPALLTIAGVSSILLIYRGIA